MNLREKLWMYAIRSHAEGTMLTKPLMLVRAALFPLDTLYWKMSRNTGYQWESDTWNIHGVKYTGKALLDLSQAQGEIYRVTRKGDCVALERMGKK